MLHVTGLPGNPTLGSHPRQPRRSRRNMEALLTRRQSRRNLLLVGVTSATTAMEYGLLMPTVLEYMRDELHVTQDIWLGLTISIFSIARTLSFPLVGIWADKRGFREPYVVCCLSLIHI